VQLGIQSTKPANKRQKPVEALIEQIEMLRQDQKQFNDRSSQCKIAISSFEVVYKKMVEEGSLAAMEVKDKIKLKSLFQDAGRAEFFNLLDDEEKEYWLFEKMND